MFSPERTEVPMFSIVLPTYNRAGMISRAIDSIRSQTFQGWELIVVDDGSSDRTREVVDSFNDERIRYVFKRNEERSIARNHGISLATARFVSFLDSDDFVDVDHLETAREFIQSNPDAMVVHLGFSICNLATGMKSPQPLPRSDGLLECLLKENLMIVNALFIRREALQDVRFAQSREAVIGEDWCLWLRLAARYRFEFYDRVTSYVVSHSDRSTHVIDPIVFRQATLVMMETLGADAVFRDALGSSRYSRLSAYLLLGIGQNFLINKNTDRAEARRYIVLAVRQDVRIMLTKRFAVCVKKLLLS